MIAVVGGTGMAGSQAVRSLAAAGREVRVLSRSAPDSLPPGATHEPFDVSSGARHAALEGVDVLVDLSNSRTRPEKVMVEGTAALLEACRTLGIAHFVGISVAGCEQVDLSYYRAKTRQEELVRDSPVGWSLLKASQFHEFVDGLLSAAARIRMLPGGSSRLQPIAGSEVGIRLAEIAQGLPLNAVETMTGPEVTTLGELSRTWRRIRRSRCLIVPLPLAGKTGRALRDGALTDAEASVQGPAFGPWLESRQG